jgi:hypothetical protein
MRRWTRREAIAAAAAWGATLAWPTRLLRGSRSPFLERRDLYPQSTGDRKKALSERNPEVAPHLSFLDWGGHGYAAVRVTEEELEVELVCVPRPIARSSAADGRPLAYRVAHRVRRWSPGEAPRVERTAVEGERPLVG